MWGLIRPLHLKTNEATVRLRDLTRGLSVHIKREASIDLIYLETAIRISTG